MLIGFWIGGQHPNLAGRFAVPLVRFGVPISVMGLLLKSGPHGDSSHGASVRTPEITKITCQYGILFPQPRDTFDAELETAHPPGAPDSDSTWPRAREKRETKRTTRDREEQLEVRGAFCFPFLARARADSVGTGALVCTDRPPPGGWVPPPTPSNLAPGRTFGAAAVPRGLTSRELTVPSCSTKSTPRRKV